MSSPSGDADRERIIAQPGVMESLRTCINALGLASSKLLREHATHDHHEDMHNHEVQTPEDTPDGTSLASSPPTPGSITNMYLESRPLPPPANFGTVVEEGIYRSSYPQAENFGFLKKLKLKTILTLVPEELSHEYRAFMVEAGIQHFHVHIPANKGEVKVQACQMSKALGILLDRSNHPVLVHCNKGKHRTGCVIGCFRRVQGTEMGSVIEEYHEYAGRKARLLDELVIENFDLGTVLWMARRYDWIQPGVEIELPSPATSTSIARS